MAQYSIFLLPLLAVALIVFFPLSFDISMSKSWKSRRRRRVLLTRYAIVVLLFATFCVLAWPIESLNFLPNKGLNKLAQGAFLSAILLAPVCIVHWILSLKNGPQNRTTKGNLSDSANDAQSSDVEPGAPFASIDMSPVVYKKGPSVVALTQTTIGNEEPSQTSELSELSGPWQTSELSEPLQSSQTSETSELSESLQPSQTSEQSESLQPSQTSEQSESLQRSQTLELLEPLHPSQTLELSELPELSDVSDVSQSSLTSELSEPLHHSQAPELSELLQSSQTSQPSEPLQPSQASELSEPLQPSQTSKLSEPLQPSQSSELSEPLQPSQTSQPSQPLQAEASMTSTRWVDGIVEDDREDSPLEVQEQLDRMSELVGSHDLGHSDNATIDKGMGSNRHGIRDIHDRHVANTKSMVTASEDPSDLAVLSNGEIAQLVKTLRKDKGRLQKLVIAQQAALDSERQAHDQSRTMTRDAIKIMRDSRNAQKHAEKLARRERTERLRVEQEYRKVRHALKNAMSIIKARKSEQMASEQESAAATG